MNEEIVSLKSASIYQQNILVLKDVNLHIRSGEFVYLIGKTGSGKSSLLATLYAELDFKEGEGKIVGFDLKRMRKKDIPKLRRNLGIVFQDFQLLTDRNVFDNLLFVLKSTGWKDKRKIKERIESVLDKVNLSTKGFKMPLQLSGGEQQRVAIARALLNDPKLILADEPTGNLDPETSEDIIKLLRKITTDDRAVLMATHDYELIKKFPSKTLICEAQTIKIFS